MLSTEGGQSIVLKSVGQLNRNTGPDFFNAQLIIDDQEWAGNVEIHIKSSDWYVHHHETDSNYDNVILHVVWEHDAEVFRSNNTPIPTLQLKNYVVSSALNTYNQLLLGHNKWINCEHQFNKVDSFLLSNWLERLYIERLEEKSKYIHQLLQQLNNHWEAVLFQLLAKNFGLKVNGDAFLSVAQSFDFSILRKLQSQSLSVEALLFGQAKMLDKDIEDGYYLSLKKEYVFLKTKFSLSNLGVIAPVFFRLRPPNFPTIRLSQLGNLYCNTPYFFSKIIETTHLEDFYTLFSVKTTPFWETHYTFKKTSSPLVKKLTKSFIDLLIINTIIPLQFAYSKATGKSINNHALGLLNKMTIEKNSIVNKFITLHEFNSSALTSQALLQLKQNYCDANKCLDCAIGSMIIGS